MNVANEKRLMFLFPRLYRGHKLSIRESCMPFGFECGDGWFDLLYDLSEKLEQQIIEFEKQHPDLDTEDAIRRKNQLWRRAILKVLHWGVCRTNYGTLWNKPLFWLLVRLHVDIPYPPMASQVKEKYGTLRFYMNYATDAMYDAISEAEDLSAATCEECGKPGKVVGKGWLMCRCQECAEKEGLDFTDYSEE
jgi:hypothetical protein